MSDEDYKSVRETLPDILPPITRAEAEKAVKRIYRKFGKLDNGRKMTRYNWSRDIRRCWLSPKPTSGHWKGWGRLIHDVSHNIFSRTYPDKTPHNPLHVSYETKIAEYVAASGWLDGGLLPKEKPKGDIKAIRYDRMLKRRKVWQSKLGRARTALAKTEREIRTYESRHPALQS